MGEAVARPLAGNRRHRRRRVQLVAGRLTYQSSDRRADRRPSMAWGLLLIAAMVARNAALASSSVVVVDALISVPTVLIALILAVPLGASIAVIVIACGFGYGLNLARVSRPAALLAARSSYVESALANGAAGGVCSAILCRIFCRYWLCNCHCRQARRCWLKVGAHLSRYRCAVRCAELGAFSGHFGETHQRVSINRGVARPDRHGCGCGAEYFW